MNMNLFADVIPMPTDSSPPFVPSVAFTAGSALTVVALLGVTSPVVLGLHSDWTTLSRWLGGAASIALCCVVTHACASIAAKDSSFRTLAVASQD